MFASFLTRSLVLLYIQKQDNSNNQHKIQSNFEKVKGLVHTYYKKAYFLNQKCGFNCSDFELSAHHSMDVDYFLYDAHTAIKIETIQWIIQDSFNQSYVTVRKSLCLYVWLKRPYKHHQMDTNEGRRRMSLDAAPTCLSACSGRTCTRIISFSLNLIGLVSPAG